MYFVEDGFCSLHLSRSRVASPVHYLLKESTFSVEETLWKNFIDWFLERGTEGGGERNIDVLFTYLCTHWLVLVCALTGNQTPSLGVSGWRSNQLSYPARAGNNWNLDTCYMSFLGLPQQNTTGWGTNLSNRNIFHSFKGWAVQD